GISPWITSDHDRDYATARSASMRPRHFAVDHQKAGGATPIGIADASMRPRHFAVDHTDVHHVTELELRRASMRPRHFAVDHSPLPGLCWHKPLRACPRALTGAGRDGAVALRDG